MRAFLITGPQQTELREVEQPEPGPGEVLVKVGAAGACHSDLHIMHQPAEEFAFPAPMTLGHENAGWVEASGAGVEGFEPGEPVAIYGILGCGYCQASAVVRTTPAATSRPVVSGSAGTAVWRPTFPYPPGN